MKAKSIKSISRVNGFTSRFVVTTNRGSQYNGEMFGYTMSLRNDGRYIGDVVFTDEQFYSKLVK